MCLRCKIMKKEHEKPVEIAPKEDVKEEKKPILRVCIIDNEESETEVYNG